MEPNTKSQAYHYERFLQFFFAPLSTWFLSPNSANDITLHYQTVDPLQGNLKANSQLIPASELRMRRLSPSASTCFHNRKAMLANREAEQETHRVSPSLVNLCSTWNDLLACFACLISLFLGLLSAHKKSRLGLGQQLLRNSFQQYKDLLHLQT